MKFPINVACKLSLRSEGILSAPINLVERYNHSLDQSEIHHNCIIIIPHLKLAIDIPDISPAGMSRTNEDATLDEVLAVVENGNSLLR